MDEKELERDENLENNPQEELIDENSDEMLNENNMEELSQMLKRAAELVKIMESTWDSSREDYKLTNEMMYKVNNFNKANLDPLPEDATDEEKENYDEFNGIYKMTEQDVEDIFGKESPIIHALEFSITLDRIKDCLMEYTSWVYTMKDYREIHDAYMNLIELQEEKDMKVLREYASKEEDPDKKAYYENILKTYEDRRTLAFLNNLDEITIKRLCDAFYNKKKIEYWLNRTMDKLRQMKVSTKCIPELSQFEKRKLPEKYHDQNNILLLYFLMVSTYCDPYDKKDDNRNKSLSIVLALDSIIRNTMKPERYEIVNQNIINFEDIFLNKLKKKAEDE